MRHDTHTLSDRPTHERILIRECSREFWKCSLFLEICGAGPPWPGEPSQRAEGTGHRGLAVLCAGTIRANEGRALYRALGRVARRIRNPAIASKVRFGRRGRCADGVRVADGINRRAWLSCVRCSARTTTRVRANPDLTRTATAATLAFGILPLSTDSQIQKNVKLLFRLAPDLGRSDEQLRLDAEAGLRVLAHFARITEVSSSATRAFASTRLRVRVVGWFRTDL